MVKIWESRFFREITQLVCGKNAKIPVSLTPSLHVLHIAVAFARTVEAN